MTTKEYRGKHKNCKYCKYYNGCSEWCRAKDQYMFAFKGIIAKICPLFEEPMDMLRETE